MEKSWLRSPRVPLRLLVPSQPVRKPSQHASWKPFSFPGDAFELFLFSWLSILYLHTHWHLLSWLIIHPDPIVHSWSPSWPWVPDLIDNSSINWKLHGAGSQTPGIPQLSPS